MTYFVSNTPLFTFFRFGSTLIVVLLSTVTALHAATSVSLPTKFATWNGLGPDKWASIWLVDRHISPGSRVSIFPVNIVPEDYLYFDIPGSKYLRDTEATTFSKLREAFSPESENIVRMAQIIRDIEVNMWLPDEDPFSLAVEQSYRALQERYDRTRVPYECYMQFFDNVQAILGEEGDDVATGGQENLLPPETCASSSKMFNSEQLVQELPVHYLLDLIRGGKKVIFVDVREPKEFAEAHIPGAFNLQIRDLSDAAAASLKEADIIVSYCVKDFRGFEMARKLQSYGFDNTVILKPYGLKGWIQMGMPVYRQGETSEQKALRELNYCLDRHAQCNAVL